jgi:hypothetical protein
MAATTLTEPAIEGRGATPSVSERNLADLAEDVR